MRFQLLLILVLLIAVGIGFSYRTPAQILDTVEFGGVSLSIEYATTTEARARGLGGRLQVPDDYGMLFVFPESGNYGFWMKDMRVPIDIFWLDDKGQVINIASNVLPSTYPDVFYPSAPARYVLETAAGFSLRHAITPGAPLKLKNIEAILK